MLAVYLLCLTVSTALAGNLCITDDDCEDLGKLTCIKTHCDWGICGCPHGSVSRYLGSFDNYKCVPMRNIGESCSTTDDTGVCGPDNSFCNQTTEECDCQLGYYPARGGEACVNRPTVGETELDSIGSCVYGSHRFNYDALEKLNPEVCTCPFGEKISFSRDVDDFYGRKQPLCVPNQVGDFCVTDLQCPLARMECKGNQCGCRSPYIRNYDGTDCGRALPIDAKCAPPDSVHLAEGHETDQYYCNGDQGLFCGDQCRVNIDVTYERSNYTCVCGPWHRRSGNSCTKIGEDSDCFGDYNCKGWKPTAVCENSKCTEGGSTMITSTIASVILPLITSLLYINNS